MNIFRFIADMLHLAAIIILLYRIKKNRNCIGMASIPFAFSPLALIIAFERRILARLFQWNAQAF